MRGLYPVCQVTELAAGYRDTTALAAKPLAHTQLEAHAIRRPGQIREGALVVTMDAPRWGSAQRTGCASLRRVHAQGDLRRGVVHLAGLEAQHGRIG
jgi:hypothetical protein